MYFPSKKDIWVIIVNWIVIFACFTPLIMKRDYEALFFTLPLPIFLLLGFFKTGYKVDEKTLIIHNGLLTKKVSIKDIEKIKRTKNPLASPALSLDRIEITSHSHNGILLVSPKNKRKFISLLKEANPDIKVDKNLNESF
ncbi:PH domain-containing protein [Priestia endophytica]|uniref:PH domain-containing protein n=1 Tax=Priestia endophytica TaxID=135735 RepID=UPI003D2A9E8E